MLSLLLRGTIPLVSVTTDDPIFVHEVLNDSAPPKREFLEVQARQLKELHKWETLKQSRFFYVVSPDEDEDWTALYERLDAKNRCLVVINPGFDNPLFHVHGTLKVSHRLMTEVVRRMIDTEEAEDIADALTGRTLLQATQTCRLALTKHKALTGAGVRDILRDYAHPVAGLVEVSRTYPFYRAEPAVSRWLKVDGRVFKNPEAPRVIVPRGLLFGGSPGTGKTLSCKVVAKRLDCPLYRIDLSSMLDMYVGNSEGNLRTALEFVDDQAPCVLMFDEIEKLFNTDDATGVMGRLLSQLLWWLQEHESRVLTIMTCNRIDELPAELFRPGRIDQTIDFPGLKPRNVRPFVKAVLKNLSQEVIMTEGEISSLVDQLSGPSRLEQATVTYAVFNHVKSHFTGDT